MIPSQVCARWIRCTVLEIINSHPGKCQFLDTNTRPMSSVVKMKIEISNTVEPRSYGHQGDMPKCPYYRGVRIMRAHS